MATGGSADEVAAEMGYLIREGEIPPGQKLPSENEAARRYGVSRPTVRVAYARLAREGLIHAVQGSGWFVRDDGRLKIPLLTYEQGRTKPNAGDVWSNFLKSTGRVGTNGVMRVRHVQPPPVVAAALNLRPGELCSVRYRVRHADGVAMSISRGCWPLWICEGTALMHTGEGSEVDLKDPSPLGIVLAKGHRITHDETVIGTRMSTPAEQKALHLGGPTPMITTRRTSFDQDGVPIRCTVDDYPGTRFELTVETEGDYR